ncbi:MAG: tetraacyldisaccharide 4'-kinase [Gemmatimonadaceae bacterium]|jgi:tetraacyldisaccharide 4'-kinase|nr:tetraacyldisaccharide 4'-kinase [Gemmatimonadaceae bacterium]
MSASAELADRLWYGRGRGAALARQLLAPAAWLFGAVVARRAARFDRGDGRVPGPVPALSVGNLTVGGTGKTPLSAWFVRAAREAGARPALVLRGYGDDEPQVHAVLNPEVPVVVNADRVAAVARAAAEGADCVVLDDAFQHRRAARVVDVVLVSVDRWDDRVRLLPAGPFREPLPALARASLVVLTEKAPAAGQRARALAAVRAATTAPVAVVRLAPDGWRPIDGGPARVAADAWRGTRVLAVSAIGDPEAFHRQLAALGLLVTPLVFADHHAYSAADVARIVATAAGAPVLCTLKDAVKLAPRWPGGAPPAWYLSQAVVPDDGAEALSAAVRALLAARGPGGGAIRSP